MATARNLATCFAVMAMLMAMAKAATYTVGDTDGWSAGIVDYSSWASDKTFKVGDKLVFTYLPNHSVLEVIKADYDSCSSSSPITTYTGGDTTITLTKAGKMYFICGTSGHCSQGQLLEVDTSAASSSPPPPATASPPPTSPVTPPPAASPPPTSPVTPPPAASPPSTSTVTPPPAASPPLSTPETSPPSPPPSTAETPPPPSSANPPPAAPPPPKGSSADKISYGASFGFALIILAAI